MISFVLIACGSDGAAADDIEAPDLLKLMLDRATKPGFSWWIDGPLGTVRGGIMTYGEAREFTGQPLQEGTSSYERRDDLTYVYVLVGKVDGRRRIGQTYEKYTGIVVGVDIETSNPAVHRLISPESEIDTALLRVIEIPEDIDSYSPRATKASPSATAADAATAITD